MWNKIRNFFQRNPGKTAVLSGAGATAIVATIATVPLSGPALAGAAVALTALAYVSGSSGWKDIKKEKLSVEEAEQIVLLNTDNQANKKKNDCHLHNILEKLEKYEAIVNTQSKKIELLEAKVNENKRSDAVEKVQIYNRIGTVQRLASQNRASMALQAHGILATAPQANDNEVVDQSQQPVRGVRR